MPQKLPTSFEMRRHGQKVIQFQLLSARAAPLGRRLVATKGALGFSAHLGSITA
jgi:hypothetical protein